MELKRSIDDYYWETYVWYRGETISNQGEAMPHGKGTSYTKEGDKIYEGMWSNGVPSGPGRLYSRIDCYQYNQISFCDGLFDDGRISSGKGYDGQGNLVYEGGLRGDYINNNIMRSGIGSSYEDNKLSYSGNWNNDFPNGPGQLYFEGRLVYDGSFKGGSKHGKGKLYHPNGRVCYDGSWDADGKHGYGKLFNTSGNLLYEGEWRGNVQRPDIEPIGQRVITYDCDIPFSQGKGFSIGKYQRNAILPTGPLTSILSAQRFLHFSRPSESIAYK